MSTGLPLSTLFDGSPHDPAVSTSILFSQVLGYIQRTGGHPHGKRNTACFGANLIYA